MIRCYFQESLAEQKLRSRFFAAKLQSQKRLCQPSAVNPVRLDLLKLVTKALEYWAAHDLSEEGRAAQLRTCVNRTSHFGFECYQAAQSQKAWKYPGNGVPMERDTASSTPNYTSVSGIAGQAGVNERLLASTVCCQEEDGKNPIGPVIARDDCGVLSLLPFPFW
ncbi:hypothetical protein Q9966_002994 [Columba livia]|nr:hypothetical protein Q9966_002994 [Columba livia]